MTSVGGDGDFSCWLSNIAHCLRIEGETMNHTFQGVNAKCLFKRVCRKLYFSVVLSAAPSRCRASGAAYETVQASLVTGQSGGSKVADVARGLSAILVPYFQFHCDSMCFGPTLLLYGLTRQHLFAKYAFLADT